MIIWDIAGGQLKYSVPKSYYLGTHGIIYVIDLTQKNQFEACYKEIEQLKAEFPNVPLVVVGNKKDLIAKNEIDLLIQSSNVEFNLLCSAKTGLNVEALFLKLAQAINEKSYA